MAATTGYQAGIETNVVQLSYAAETTWGSLPSVQFQALRMTGESLSGRKDRQRPSEIITTRESAAAITTQESAGGSINFGLSFGTYDDLFAGCLNNDWQAAQTITGATGDITITSGTKKLTSTTAGKFTNISAGQWIRLLGFSNAGNNGFWYVTTKTSSQDITLSGTGTIVTETPTGAAAQVRARTIMNSTLFKSFYFQKKFSSSLWLRYPGCYVSGFTVQGGVGQFISGSFNLMAQAQTSSTTDASTGAVLAAPTGKIHDPIGGFGGVLWNETAFSGGIDSFTLNVTNDGAAAEYAMGSASAAGMRPGAMTVSGSLNMFFKSLTEYTNFTNETVGRLAIITKDDTAQALIFTLPAATIMNPQIVAQGPGQTVKAQFDIEGNPTSTGGTIVIDKLAAV